MPKYLPSVAYLHKILRYDPQTGKLRWRRRTPDMFSEDGTPVSRTICKAWNTRLANKPALNALRDGVFVGEINGVSFPAHRVVFAMHYGGWPVNVVKHINGNRLDNRPCNLRETDSPIPSPSPTSPLGVHWDEERQQWAANVKVGYKIVCVGWYSRFEDALAITKNPDVRRKLRFHA